MMLRQFKRMTVILSLYFVFSVLLNTAEAASNQISIKLETFKSHSRLSMYAEKHMDISFKEIKDGFEIFFKDLTLFDLGAPMGKEREWLERHANIQDYRMLSFKLTETPEGVVARGLWKFPQGKKAFHNPKMKRFSFRRTDHPLYVTDFWYAKGPTAVEMRRKQKETSKILAATKNKEKEEERKDYERRMQSAEPLALPEPDTVAFCKEPLTKKNDIFLKFKPVHKEPDFAKWFGMLSPDEEYPYLQPAGNSQEAQYIRLAIKLYRAGKTALSIRTVEFFDKDIGPSKYSEQMHFLKANALIQLGHRDQAEKIFKRIAKSPSKSPVKLNAAMYLAGQAFEMGNYLIALDLFNRLTKHYPNHNRLSWVFHLGAAECLYRIGDAEQSRDEYAKSIDKVPEGDEKSQALVASRLGDIYLARGQNAQALATYYRVIKHYGDRVKLGPEILLNRAESLFWLDQIDRARIEYQNFLKIYPSYPEGWRATLRIAEILMQNEDPQKRKEGHKWLRRTINRYPGSPGMTIARLKIIPCEDHGGFKAQSAKLFLETEAQKFDRPEALEMSYYQDLLALYHVRSMIAFEKYAKTVSSSEKLLRKVALNRTIGMVNQSSRLAFRKHILNLLKHDKGFKALSYYTLHFDSVTDGGDPLPPRFQLELAGIAAEFKLPTLANRILDDFDKVYSEYKKDSSLGQVIRERLASEAHYSRGKILWMGRGKAAANEIRDILGKISQDSYYQIEKEVILGLLSEAEGKPGIALKHAQNARTYLSRIPDKDVKTIRNPELSYWIAKLQKEKGNFEMAGNILHKLKMTGQDQGENFRAIAGNQTRFGKATLIPLGTPQIPTLEQISISEAEAYVKAGMYGKAASAYGNAVSSGVGEPGILFTYARVLSKTGKSRDKAEAMKILQRILKDSTDPFWNRMAQKVLERKAVF